MAASEQSDVTLLKATIIASMFLYSLRNFICSKWGKLTNAQFAIFVQQGVNPLTL
jgi:hypothetical protein